MLWPMQDGGRRRTGRRGPHKASEASLWRAAVGYLRRSASSADNLERVLRRRVERSARAHGTDRDEGAAAVREIMRRLGIRTSGKIPLVGKKRLSLTCETLY